VSSPGLADVVSTLHVPNPFETVQVLPALNEPTCAPTKANVTIVPFGASVYAGPEPAFTNTCAVYVCVVFTGFVAAGGLIVIYASTNVFTAFPEFGATPSVATVNGAEPETEPVQDACPATVPAACELKVTDTCPAAFVFKLNGPAGTGLAPFAAINVTVTG